MLKRKLSSRKFIVTVLGAVLVVAGEAGGVEVPWEAVVVIVSYILGEGAVDALDRFRHGKTP